MGGQVGDRGLITVGSAKAEVLTTFNLPNGIYIHKVTGINGNIKAGDICNVEVTIPLRKATMRNHTATHLMHKALREVLGDHANQAGSLVTEDRLRFDFNHFSAVTPEELQKIEDRVNAEIMKRFRSCYQGNGS